MRISDWSSDVCSSDLFHRCANRDFTAAEAGEKSRRIGSGIPQVRQGRGVVAFGEAASRSVGDQGMMVIDGRRQIEQRLQQPVDVGCRKRSEEHTSELQSLMRISYAVFCLKKKKKKKQNNTEH